MHFLPILRTFQKNLLKNTTYRKTQIMLILDVVKIFFKKFLKNFYEI